MKANRMYNQNNHVKVSFDSATKAEVTWTSSRKKPNWRRPRNIPGIMLPTTKLPMEMMALTLLVHDGASDTNE